jgi:hypothetical protein
MNRPTSSGSTTEPSRGWLAVKVHTSTASASLAHAHV